MTRDLSRRSFLGRSVALGCSLAASPLVTPVSFAAAPWDTRLVVIILRGGMDGLDAVRPYGAPEYTGMRSGFGGGPEDGAPDLDGYFALHPAMSPLLPLWSAGEMGVVNAVSTPYRGKRSHFDGQDLLEAGTDTLAGARDGWLNRMLQALPGVEAETAYAIGRGEMKLLMGRAPVADWSPEADLVMSPQAMRLAELVMQEDPAFHAAFAEAMMLSSDEGGIGLDAGGGMDGMMSGEEASASMRRDMRSAIRGAMHVKIAEFAAERLRGDTRVAAFSLTGWDTHRAQKRHLSTALTRLSDTLLTLREGLGVDVWGKTAVVVMTEFGRTVRENGTGGTDHGTGGAMLLAGGAIRGRKVHGDWPGLAEEDLYERRDLMPTMDVRAPAAWIMRGLTGIDRGTLEASVFPGLDMGRDPGLLL